MITRFSLFLYLLLLWVMPSCSINKKLFVDNKKVAVVDDYEKTTFISFQPDFTSLRRLVVIYADSLNSEESRKLFSYNSIKVSPSELRYLDRLFRDAIKSVGDKGYKQDSTTGFTIRMQVVHPYMDFQGSVLASMFIDNLVNKINGAGNNISIDSKAKLIEVLNERILHLKTE